MGTSPGRKQALLIKMIVLVDNSKDEDIRKTCPKLIELLQELSVSFVVVTSTSELWSTMSYGRVDGIILSGSGKRLSSGECRPINFLPFHFHNIPILGICYGFQCMATLLGTKIVEDAYFQKGTINVYVREHEAPIFLGMPRIFQLKQIHHDSIEETPPNCTPLFTDYKQGFMHNNYPWFGLQGHPELSGTSGKTLIKNFIQFSQRY